MKYTNIQITVNSTSEYEEGEFTLCNLTLDEAAQLIADNAPNWTSMVLVVVRNDA